jgi:serine/threonine protein kinase
MAHSVKYLHKEKIAHRDIKPQNMMIKIEGGAVETKLIDFNISKKNQKKKKEARKLGDRKFSLDVLNEEYGAFSCKFLTHIGSPYY